MSDVRVVVDFPALPRRAFEQPGAVLLADTLEDVRLAIAEAERQARNGKWVVGFVAYEAAPAFDAAMRVCPPASLPLAWFAVFESSHAAETGAPVAAPASEWRLATDRDRFMHAVARIRAEIASGRTYQVNLTAQLIASPHEEPLALYESLRAGQGAGYHACIRTDEFSIVSASPELFFETSDRRIRTRPMKGTRPRGRFTEEDRLSAEELKDSAKDRAENLMIVDLLRNDLGRIAEFGSVRVTSLYDVERYRTVHQLTSTIEADLRDDVTLPDVFGALFPCGSVTGAPKISTMQIITELESAPRGVYCGALGIIEPGGAATFNVPIRTVWYDHFTRRAVYGTGAGITYDSDPAAEFAEIVAKTAVLVEAWPTFELLETMRLERDTVVRAERHIARLLDSARYFDFAADESRIRAALAELHTPGMARVRLLVNETGQVRSEALPLTRSESFDVALAGTPVSSRDRFLFHKTTHRRVYESRLIDGFDDVLLWNERGEVTEFTRGNVVVEMAGALLTPPRSCGLLAGVYRAQLIAEGVLEERVIALADLADASRIWLINSLREWVSVRLHAPDLSDSPFPL